MGIVIQLNGAPREVPQGQTVAELVSELGLLPEQVAVELNQELVAREERALRGLQAGDAVELVTMVGGAKWLKMDCVLAICSFPLGYWSVRVSTPLSLRWLSA